MRFQTLIFAFAVAGLAAVMSFGQAPADGGLAGKLTEKYALTTPNAEWDVVTQGCTLVLKKRGLSASAVGAKVVNMSYFKDRDPAIRSGAASTARKNLSRFGGIGSMIPGVGGMVSAANSANSAAGSDTREFTNGEKMFVTKIDVDPVKDTITFSLFSNPVKEVRYVAQLRFEFAKGSLATADLAQIQPVLDQAIGIAPPDKDAGAAAPDAPSAPEPAPAPAPAPAAEAPLAPIAPPPPPPAATTSTSSIENGMTKDQVIAILGQPKSVVKSGAKEILTYADLKVIFVNGKMTDAQ
jgi:hypothetical protein